jgi:hypothetical protein
VTEVLLKVLFDRALLPAHSGKLLNHAAAFTAATKDMARCWSYNHEYANGIQFSELYGTPTWWTTSWHFADTG